MWISFPSLFQEDWTAVYYTPLYYFWWWLYLQYSTSSVARACFQNAASSWSPRWHSRTRTQTWRTIDTWKASGRRRRGRVRGVSKSCKFHLLAPWTSRGTSSHGCRKPRCPWRASPAETFGDIIYIKSCICLSCHSHLQCLQCLKYKY